MALCATSRGKDNPEQELQINAVYCIYNCPAPGEEYEIESFFRYWSNATQWPDGRLPAAGENVTVPGPWKLIVDMQPEEIGFWQVDGLVIFRPGVTPSPLHIKAKAVYILSGQMITEPNTDMDYYNG